MNGNDEIRLSRLLSYMNKVFSVDKRMDSLTDSRKQCSVRLRTVVTIVLVGFIMQLPSFYQIFSQSNFRKRMSHLFSKGTKLPKIDCARMALEGIAVGELKAIHVDVVQTIRKNKVLTRGTIDGLVVSAIDGVELFSSDKKCCSECLTRERKDGTIEYFHRSVVCMTIGSDPHVIFGQEFLKPRDGSEKDEGELTGAKRLVENLYEAHKHFADVIVGDALYLNAPFINTVLSKRIDVVIRAKDESRIILQDALGLVRKREADTRFAVKNREVEVWDESGLEMTGVKQRLRFLQFRETTIPKTGKRVERTIWAFTSLAQPAQTIYTIMVKRWDIENNGFHQLKTYYHADHCYDHGAVEAIFMLNILAFNLREMYLFRRIKDFRERKETRINVTQNWSDQLLLSDHSMFFCFNSG